MLSIGMIISLLSTSLFTEKVHDGQTFIASIEAAGLDMDMRRVREGK